MKRVLFFLVLASAAGAWVTHEQGAIVIAWFTKLSATAKTDDQESIAAVPVVAAEARYANVPVTADTVGTMTALNSVLIRSQVDGRLLKLAFKEGQDVKRGDLIAQIDPVTYQALYEQSVAKKTQDEANLANAMADLERYDKLAQSGAGPRQQADTQRSLVAQLSAQLAVDQAAIDNAKAVLDYTTIRSPLAGRAGIRQVDEGNLIHAMDATGIATIAQIEPIALIFNLPQQQLRSVREATRRGAVAVRALDADNATVLGEGQIDVIDNQVDQTTGTIKIRAVFPNEDLTLWPGQFVNVRVFTGELTHVVVVPVAAVQRGPQGPFVYVVGDNGRAAVTPVTIGWQDDTLAVVQSGVEPPVRVVTTGFSRLIDQTRIRIALLEDAPQAKVAEAIQAEARKSLKQNRSEAPVP